MKKWKTLRGTDLSEFSTTARAQDLGADFALHVAKYGTQQDYHAFLNASATPLDTCTEYFLASPSASSAWLISHLKTSKDPYSHLSAAHHILYNVETLLTENCDPYKILAYVDFTNIPEDENLGVFHALVYAAAFDLIRDHWDLYEKAIQNDVGENVMFAAQWGLDIRTRVNWKPTTLDETHTYFTACCRGGLLQRVKELAIDPNDKKLLRNSFVLSISNPYAYEVLEHLWNTYPNTNWYQEGLILNAVCNITQPLRTKVIDHFVKHHPNVSHNILTTIASTAICDRKSDIYKFVFPYIPVKNYPQLMRTAILHRHKKVLQELLQGPKASQLFNKALSGSEPTNQQWALEVFAEVQNKTLKNVVAVKKDAQPTRRKM